MRDKTSCTHYYIQGFLFALLQVYFSGCNAIADLSLGGGIGSPCTVDSECHHSRCVFDSSTASKSPAVRSPAGVCSLSCQSNSDCISDSTCAAGYCRPISSVAAIFVGNANDSDGWTLAHDQGLRAAASSLGYVHLNVKYGVLASGVQSIVSNLPATTGVVLGNGIQYEAALRSAASQNPGTQYLLIDNLLYGSGSANFTPYGMYLDEGYYLAGRLAAQRAKKRIGYISSFIAPQSVRLLNAFTLGARSVNPQILVEVRHIGFFADPNTTPTQNYIPLAGPSISYFREQLLTRQLIDSGCDVIAQYSNTQRMVQLVDSLEAAGTITPGSVSTITFGSRESCGGALVPSCMGVVYTDWLQMYRGIIDQVARRSFDPLLPVRGSIDDSQQSPVGYAPNGGGRSVDVSAVLQENQNLARMTDPSPRQRVFLGPYNLNGQRDSNFDGIPDPPALQRIEEGESLTDQENARACFYVEGVVERLNPDNPNSADRPALVPGGLVPGAVGAGSSEPLLQGTTNKLTLPPGQPTECRKNASPAP